MAGAVAAGVQPAEEVEEGVESFAIALCGLVGEAGDHGVEELPSCTAEFCSGVVVSIR